MTSKYISEMYLCDDGQIYLVCFQIFDTELKDQEREVCFIDIAYDEIPERYYKESEVSLCRCVCVCLKAVS